MTFGGKRPTFGSCRQRRLACLETAVRLSAQQPPAAQPPIVTEKLFRNIQVLKGIPIDTFFDVMGMFASSMGEDCTFCHSKEAVFRHEAFGDETPRIPAARQMIAMMNGINETQLRRPADGDLFHLPQGEQHARQRAASVAAVRRARRRSERHQLSP